MLDDPEKKDSSEKEFIIAVSAVNTSCCFFTLLALFLLLRARSGVMNAIMTELGETLTTWEGVIIPVEMTTLLLSGVLAACTGFYLTRKLGRGFAKRCSELNYRRIALSVAGLLIGMIFFLSGLLGLLVALVATSLGLIPPLVGVKRVHLMGCLILPLIVLFMG